MYVSFAIALLGAFAGGVFARQFFMQDTRSSMGQRETDRIMQALVRSADVEIGRQANSCEITSAPTMKVGNFISDAMSFRFEGGWRSFENLSCDGEGLLKCEWAFGKAKSEEGWGRILRFRYLPRSDTIDAASIECVDVP